MAELGPDIAEIVATTAQAATADIAAAFQRAFDVHPEVAVEVLSAFDWAEVAEELGGEGLAMVLNVGESAAMLLLPASSGLLPEWYAEPDEAGDSKLAALAQELSTLLLPDELVADDVQASRVENLLEAIERGGVAAGASLLPFALKAGDKGGRLLMIWPAPTAGRVIDANASQAGGGSPPESTASAAEPSSPRPRGSADRRIKYDTIDDGLRQLPNYARSILRIEVPVIVTLASTKYSVNRIVELGPGSIIQFDKSCDETLSLEVGGQEVAVGEAVKVGDKFGLRLTSMIMPEERFWTVRGLRGIEKAVGRKRNTP